MIIAVVFIISILVSCGITFVLSYRKGYIKGVKEVTLQWQDNNAEIEKILGKMLYEPIAEEVHTDTQGV